MGNTSEKRKKMKDLQKSAKEKLAERVYERDEENRIVITMNVRNDDSFLSPFSETDKPVISSGVAEFIEESVNGISPYEQYALHVKSNCIDETEQETYTVAVQEYFQKRYRQNENEIQRNRVVAVLCAVVGILVLAVALFLQYQLGEIWAEVVDIVAWVLIWEAVYLEAFENRKARIRGCYYLACMTMKIQYITV